MQGTRKTSLLLFGAVLLVAAVTPNASAQNVDQLVSVAWQNNPTLDALDARIAGQGHNTAMAGAWPNPVVSVEYSNVPLDTFALDESPMSGVQFRYQQRLPFPGKTAKRRGSERERRLGLEQAKAERQNQLRLMVHQAYWSLTRTRWLRGINEAQLGEIARLTSVVRSRFEVGGAGRHNLLRLDVLAQRLQQETNDLARQEIEITASLNSLLARSPETAISTPPRPAPVMAPDDDAAVLATALASRPEVARLQLAAKTARAAAERAGYEAWPDPTLWVGYRLREEIVGPDGMVRDEGADFISLGLGLELPLFHSRNWGAKRRAALAGENQARAEERAAVDQLKGELAGAMAGWRRAQAKASDYEQSVAPAQRGVWEATLSAYRVGQADFNAVYDVTLGLLDVERTYAAAVIDTHLRRAQVQALVGDKLPGNGENP